MVAVKRLIVVICHEKRRLVSLQQALFPDVGIGVVNESARLYVSVCVYVKVVPSSCDTAVNEFAVILKIYGKYRLCRRS